MNLGLIPIIMSVVVIALCSLAGVVGTALLISSESRACRFLGKMMLIVAVSLLHQQSPHRGEQVQVRIGDPGQTVG